MTPEQIKDIRYALDITCDMDGPAHCAMLPGFEDMMSSPCGFGDTEDEAIRALLLDALTARSRPNATKLILTRTHLGLHSISETEGSTSLETWLFDNTEPVNNYTLTLEKLEVS